MFLTCFIVFPDCFLWWIHKHENSYGVLNELKSLMNVVRMFHYINIYFFVFWIILFVFLTVFFLANLFIYFSHKHTHVKPFIKNLSLENAKMEIEWSFCMAQHLHKYLFINIALLQTFKLFIKYLIALLTFCVFYCCEK